MTTEMTDEQLQQHLDEAARQQAEKELVKATRAALQTFKELVPTYQDTAENRKALAEKMEAMSALPTNVKAYVTAWHAVCADRIEYNGKRGLAAIDAMSSAFMQQQLNSDRNFSFGVNYLLEQAGK